MIRVLALLALLAPATASAEISRIIYLNRCSGGCTVNGGVDDARTMSSSLPCAAGASCGGGTCYCSGGSQGTYTIEEFTNAAGETGAAADAEWNAIVQCVREVYSPFNVTVTDVAPPPGTAHTQGIVAGRPQNIGWGGLGVGGLGSNGIGCEPKDNYISFSFANIFGGTGMARVYNLCAVAAQETGHSFGLEHAYEFADGRSACSDPMSYRGDCAGQRFFRNQGAWCGEYAKRTCACGGQQNSHQKLINFFGPGTPLTAPPTLTINAPAAGDTVGNGATVVATAFAQRGVARLDLYLNGYKWLTVKGAPFGANGQPETSYPLTFPAEVPDGITDIVVKAYDDIEAETVSPSLTVTKGAPCATADTCAKGQKCEAGKCFWDPPAGELGDACTYAQFCKSGTCLETTDGAQYCSQTCVVGVGDSCPAGFVCDGEQNTSGFCITDTPAESGCCGVGASGRTSGLLALLVLAAITLRSPRQRGRALPPAARRP